MRALSTLVVAVALLAVASSASLLTQRVANEALTGQQQQKRKEVDSARRASHNHLAARGPFGNKDDAANEYGTVYRLIYELGTALVLRNYTRAGELLDDQGFYFVPDMSCGFVNKTAFLAQAAQSPMFTRAIYFQLGEWVGFQNNSALIRATVASVLNGNTGAAANTTNVDTNVWLFGMTNSDGTKLYGFEQITNQAYHQANATAMIRVWEKLHAAVLLKDIDAVSKLLSDDAELSITFAWDQFPMQQFNNKTAVVNYIQQGWFNVEHVHIDVRSAFASCFWVVVNMVWSGINPDGSASIMDFAFALSLDENFKIVQISQYAMMPFLN